MASFYMRTEKTTIFLCIVITSFATSRHNSKRLFEVDDLNVIKEVCSENKY